MKPKKSHLFFFFFLFSLSWGLQVKVLCCPWYKKASDFALSLILFKKKKKETKKRKVLYRIWDLCQGHQSGSPSWNLFFLSFVKKHFKVWSLGTSPPVTNHKEQSQEHPCTVYSCMYSLWTNIMPSPVPLKIRWIFKSPSYPSHPYFKPLMWFIQILRITSLYYIIWIQNRAK